MRPGSQLKIEELAPMHLPHRPPGKNRMENSCILKSWLYTHLDAGCIFMTVTAEKEAEIASLSSIAQGQWKFSPSQTYPPCRESSWPHGHKQSWPRERHHPYRGLQEQNRTQHPCTASSTLLSQLAWLKLPRDSCPG